jgi:hypothetical protein
VVWSEIPLFGFFKNEWNGMEWYVMVFIPFHSIIFSHFSSPPIWGAESKHFTKYPNNGIKFMFHFIPFYSIPLRSVLLCTTNPNIAYPSCFKCGIRASSTYVGAGESSRAGLQMRRFSLT